jgi:D-3-phosphoglycerate dehydrogenase
MKILIADHVDGCCGELLRARGFEVEESPGANSNQFLEKIAAADGLIVRSATKVTAQLLALAPKLKVIGRAGAGVDNIDVAAAAQRGIAVFNAAAANTVSAAEHTLALMLALARHLPRAHVSLTQGRWNRAEFQGVELAGKILGIIGLGKIGREVAARANAFGMRVIAFDPLIAPEMFAAAGAEASTLEHLIRSSDFISIHAPFSSATRYLIGEEQLKICKPSVRLINTARGGIIDEQALWRALQDGRVAGAALDVFENEPPGELPLLRLPNVVATPHLGASTVEAQRRVAEEIAGVVADFLLNKKVENAVNPDGLET